MGRPHLFHIVAAPVWAAADASYVPDSLAEQGFVHLSERDQVAAVANRWYSDGADLVVVELDPARLGADIVDEDLYGGGELFPHLYGPVPTAAAVAVHPLPRTGDGTFAFPA